MDMAQLLAIDLGDFNTVNSFGDVLWFLIGLLMLTGITYAVIRINQRTSPDPFEIKNK